MWLAVFWEAAGFIALVGLVRYFHLQGKLGMAIGAAYFIAVHWYGVRRGRGM